jgi:hypothetical protein
MESFEALKAGMERIGEVMIRLKTVEKIELYKQNAKFENATKEILVSSGTNEIHVYRTDLT